MAFSYHWGRPKSVASQVPELRQRKIGITLFACPCDRTEGTAVPKDTHRTAATGLAELKLPDQVTIAVAELAGAARLSRPDFTGWLLRACCLVPPSPPSLQRRIEGSS